MYTLTMFASYIPNPTKCHFEGQDPEEKILLLLRAHPVTNISWFMPAAFIFTFPFMLAYILPYLGIRLETIPDVISIPFLIMNYLLVLVMSFEGFIHWYFNATLITNEKIVDIDFDSLLHKSVDLAPLSKIEEADSTISGLLGTFFNYGHVTVQTAGSQIAIEMRSVPRPAEVADLILDLSKKAHTNHGGNLNNAHN